VEIRSRSGISVCWNFLGRSLNSETKSSSNSSSSTQLGCDCFFLPPPLFLSDSASSSFVFLLASLSFVAVAFVVLFLPPPPLVFARSNEDGFLVEVEFSFLDFNAVELSFFTTTSVSVMSSVLVLGFGLANLVWFLKELG